MCIFREIWMFQHICPPHFIQMSLCPHRLPSEFGINVEMNKCENTRLELKIQRDGRCTFAIPIDSSVIPSRLSLDLHQHQHRQQRPVVARDWPYSLASVEWRILMAVATIPGVGEWTGNGRGLRNVSTGIVEIFNECH